MKQQIFNNDLNVLQLSYQQTHQYEAAENKQITLLRNQRLNDAGNQVNMSQSNFTSLNTNKEPVSPISSLNNGGILIPTGHFKKSSQAKPSPRKKDQMSGVEFKSTSPRKSIEVQTPSDRILLDQVDQFQLLGENKHKLRSTKNVHHPIKLT